MQILICCRHCTTLVGQLEYPFEVLDPGRRNTKHLTQGIRARDTLLGYHRNEECLVNLVARRRRACALAFTGYVRDELGAPCLHLRGSGLWIRGCVVYMCHVGGEEFGGWVEKGGVRGPVKGRVHGESVWRCGM